MKKYCPRCEREKELTLFGKRGLSKKTGKPLYNSWCKRCVLDDGKIRRDKKEIKRSPLKALRETVRVRYKGTINPKYLVRGTITIGSKRCNITGGEYAR